jgi:pyrophosphatase PpaX
VRYPVVLFDFDGTLVDSGWIILASFRHATRTVLEREIPDEVLVRGVGGSGIHEQMAAIDELRADELVQAYREHNEPLHAELEAFDGIMELLDELRAEGRSLGIVTAKRLGTVQLAFDKLGLEGYFRAVVSREQTTHGKPHPEPVLRALELLGAAPSEAAFVGDSPYDMGAGRAAGVFTVGVSWGGIHGADRLAAEGADVIVHSVSELRRVLS